MVTQNDTSGEYMICGKILEREVGWYDCIACC